MANEEKNEPKYVPIEDVHAVLKSLENKIDARLGEKEDSPELKAEKEKLRVPSVKDLEKFGDELLEKADKRQSEKEHIESARDRGKQEFNSLTDYNKKLAEKNEVEWNEGVDTVFNALATQYAEMQALRVQADKRTEFTDSDWEAIHKNVNNVMKNVFKFEDPEEAEEALEEAMEETEEEIEKLQKKASVVPKKVKSPSFINEQVAVGLKQSEVDTLLKRLEKGDIDGDEALLIKTQLISKMDRETRKRVLGHK